MCGRSSRLFVFLLSAVGAELAWVPPSSCSVTVGSAQLASNLVTTQKGSAVGLRARTVSELGLDQGAAVAIAELVDTWETTSSVSPNIGAIPSRALHQSLPRTWHNVRGKNGLWRQWSPDCSSFGPLSPLDAAGRTQTMSATADCPVQPCRGSKRTLTFPYFLNLRWKRRKQIRCWNYAEQKVEAQNY